MAMQFAWDKQLANWSGNDPCLDKWTAISCTGNRVTSMLVSAAYIYIYGYMWPQTQFLFLDKRSQIVLLLFPFDRCLSCLLFCRKLGNLELSGTLSGDIQSLKELKDLYANSSGFTV